MKMNLENILLSKKQVVAYEKYDTIYVKCTNRKSKTTFL